MELKYHSIPSRAESDNPIGCACGPVSPRASQNGKLHGSSLLVCGDQTLIIAFGCRGCRRRGRLNFWKTRMRGRAMSAIWSLNRPVSGIHETPEKRSGEPPSGRAGQRACIANKINQQNPQKAFGGTAVLAMPPRLRCDTELLRWLDHDEICSSTVVDQQQDRLLTGAGDRLVVFVHVVHGLVIHFLNHVAAAQSRGRCLA